MQTQSITLMQAAPGVSHSFQAFHFGQPDAGPKAYIQAALHADEVPAILVAHALKRHLLRLEDAGLLLGEVVLVPCANPVGMGQQILGQHQGRFDLRDGVNFNRGYANLAPLVGKMLRDQLGNDAALNVRLVREAMREAAAGLRAAHPVQDLKNHLLQLAADSDVVLDLHCDHEAVMHLYALTPQRVQAQELGALLGAEAILLSAESGDSPFDEACSRPWLVMQQQFEDLPLPLGCFSATVELRGEADTSHTLAEQDALALLDFLRLRGVVGGPKPKLPALRCQPTPLSGSEPVTAPCAGVVVFHRAPGDYVRSGDLIADMIDVETGRHVPIRCVSDGVFYARGGVRWAPAGKRLGKIAGTLLTRTGKLLSP
jgi:uncharacterized protein